MSLTTEEVWEQYQEYTHDLTENGRKLAFAAAAICWILKEDAGTFPFLVVVAFLGVVLFFLLDIAHSAWGAWSNFSLARDTEKRGWENLPEEERRKPGIRNFQVDKPDSADRPMRWMLVSKTVLLGAAYVLLLFELSRRLL